MIDTSKKLVLVANGNFVEKWNKIRSVAESGGFKLDIEYIYFDGTLTEMPFRLVKTTNTLQPSKPG